MNSELKRISLITLVVFLVLTLGINVHTYLDSSKFIPEASRRSQVRNINLLRPTNLNHPSEHHNYPNLRQAKKLHLVAEPALKRVYVLSGHRVIYIMHAQINLHPQRLTSQAKSGQQLYQKRGSQLVTGLNWTEFGHHYYFESVAAVNQQTVKKNWLKKPVAIPGTIQLSQPDARWLQSLPEGTPITIR
ncbi:hypothetical protein [Limosilactobacillus sp.]|uniref:hypothetical protein n=1 Tax=Limosilactobacillus sp. TaxID=2773925 RepID=UPI003F0652B1